MKKSIVVIFLFFLVLIFQVLHVFRDIKITNANINIKKVYENENILSEYNILLKSEDYKYEKYEPYDSCYLGAYVLSSKNINYSIDGLNEDTNKKHGISLYYLTVGNVVPDLWILECIRNTITPCIILQPFDTENPYQKYLIEKSIKSFNKFNIPFFVQIYPNPSELNGSNKEYIEFYKYASDLIDEFAPNVAKVWAVEDNNLYESLLYYPGDSYVNWIGLCMYIDFDELNNHDVTNSIKIFYESYETKKPLMIAQLGISDYSNKTQEYAVKRKVDLLTNIYYKIISEYPRIKAINYLNYNDITLDQGKMTGNNYSLTDNSSTLKCYTEIVGNKHFTNTVTDEYNYSLLDEVYNYKNFVLKKDGKYYFEEKIFNLNILNINKSKLIKFKVDFNNKYFYPIDKILSKEIYSVSVSEEKKEVYINRKETNKP